MPPNKFKDEPKHFVENVEACIAKEAFMMALYSGDVPFVFVLTPSHMKRVAQWFNFQVENYEKTFGPVIVEPWTPSIPSSFMEDFKKPRGK